MSAEENGQPAACQSPYCPARAFEGAEKDEAGHVTVNGRTYHFGCWWKMRAKALTASGLQQR